MLTRVHEQCVTVLLYILFLIKHQQQRRSFEQGLNKLFKQAWETNI